MPDNDPDVRSLQEPEAKKSEKVFAVIVLAGLATAVFKPAVDAFLRREFATGFALVVISAFLAWAAAQWARFTKMVGPVLSRSVLGVANSAWTWLALIITLILYAGWPGELFGLRDVQKTPSRLLQAQVTPQTQLPSRAVSGPVGRPATRTVGYYLGVNNSATPARAAQQLSAFVGERLQIKGSVETNWSSVGDTGFNIKLLDGEAFCIFEGPHDEIDRLKTGDQVTMAGNIMPNVMNARLGLMGCQLLK